MTYINSDTDTEEYIHRMDYSIKRIRFKNGQGKVLIYKQVPEEDVSVVVREYDTHNFTDMKLYDAFTNVLQDSVSDAEFEALLEGLRLKKRDGVLDVYMLGDYLKYFHTVRE
jgi:hypothetical protein